MREMLNCEQTKGQSVYQHGVSVKNHFDQLLDHLKENTNINWKIPKWVYEYKDDILVNLYNKKICDTYTLLHDIGKPYCKEIDSDGKVHFPNHAAVSKQIFLSLEDLTDFTADEKQIIGNLIGWDMVLHQSNSEEIQEYLNLWTAQDASTLLVVALSEIHSNAMMFGGLESSSFRIKLKQLDRRGKQICKHFFSERKNNDRNIQK